MAVAAIRAYNSSAHSTSSGGTATLTFDGENSDVGDLHDTSSDTSRLTAPVAGVYTISATAVWGSSTIGLRFIGLRVNGSTYIAQSVTPASSINAALNVATQYVLGVGDYAEVLVYQDSGLSLSVDGHLEMTFVAPAPR